MKGLKDKPSEDFLNFVLSTLIIITIGACHGPDWSKKVSGGLRLKNPDETGIDFSNDLAESHEMNIIIYQDFYSGGGVSIGDINNDSLPDLFFTGNMVPCRLYLNQGKFLFKDITSSAGLSNMGKGWYTGTTMADVNNDGYLDIYISKSGMFEPDDRRNLLFINNGDGTFTEKAYQYGLDQPGYSVNATFFDYDNDGDLDMFLVNQGPEKFQREDIQKLRNENSLYCGDKLFENRDGKFIDVTDDAGIISSVIGFGHGVSIGDVNEDGWQDIFVSNDFFEHDYLYLNNGDKTFTEALKKSFKHISNFSMGNDMADFNNDGLLDIMVLDMVAEGNRRLKANLGGSNYFKFNNYVKMGFYYQYMYNVLHMNNGNTTFSDIGMLAGISYTDWSWGPLFADFDNDGLKDLFIANGIRKDIRNIDWGKQYYKLMRLTHGRMEFKPSEWDMLLSTLPSEKVDNYMFRNRGDLTFEKVMDKWGLETPSFSNGSAYGDLDGDGDLDLVVNNIDDKAFVYENTFSNDTSRHYLQFKFKGPPDNPFAIGTEVHVYTGDSLQYQQLYLTHGYRSSIEPLLHFGLGKNKSVDSVLISWPDSKVTRLYNVLADRLLKIDYSAAEKTVFHHPVKSPGYFAEATSKLDLKCKHEENEYNDFLREPMLPHKMSTFGPGLAVADVNGDGLEDFYIGGAFRHRGHLFIQDEHGKFQDSDSAFWMGQRLHEDMGALFLDVDQDGDMDLYVVSGGNEFNEGSASLQDRLYFNDGRGHFIEMEDALPVIRTSGSVVLASDFDNDGDPDLFIGGRQVPGRYPLPADSYLLRNDGGKFTDVTGEKAPDLKKLGMVTAAVWTDYDSDGDQDLIVTGEWMPVTIFTNNSGTFKKESNTENGLRYSAGWWWCISAHDLDGDGDEDLVAGNLGLNYRYKASIDEPFQIYSADFDANGKRDIVLAYYNDNHTLYPLRNRHYTVTQIPSLAERFPTDDQFAVATLEDVYGKKALDSALHYNAYTFASCYIENKGDGKFKMKPFPNLAQISNQNAIIFNDVDRDGHDDIIMAGNLYASEVHTIRNDAGIGNWIKCDGHGNFRAVPYRISGLYIDGDVKDLKLIHVSGKEFLLAAKNNDYLQAVEIKGPASQ